MRRLVAEEIVDLASYAAARPDYRRALIAHKKDRRVAVGDRVTLVFEDRETLRFQVQEMLFVERIEDPTGIQNELDVYNELMPGDRELSATLFIEITDLPEIRPELLRLVGLDEHVSLELGAGETAIRIPARFDPKQLEEDRLSAVQYVRFPLDEAQARRFQDPHTRLALRIDHPAYAREVEISDAVRRSLATGLRGEPAPLLDVAAFERPRDTVLFESGRIRATALGAAPPARTHVVVETIGGEPVDDVLLAELARAVRRVARQIAADHGRARVQADFAAETDAARWHVFAVDAAG